MNAPTPCPHAELMAEYAKDAAVHPEPWKLWQLKMRGWQGWGDLNANPHWDPDSQYRRKPEPIKTHEVNGFTVPAPITEAPAYGTDCWMPTVTDGDWTERLYWSNHSYDRQCLQRGLIHLTKEAAVANAKAMCKIDQLKEN